MDRLIARAGILTLVLSLSSASDAWAHVGLGPAHGALHGLAHPLGGIDHILAMLAVGLLAARWKGRTVLVLPGVFLVMMGAGFVLGARGVPVPYLETAIAVSVAVLGLAVAVGTRPPLAVATAMVGVFAIVHGYAHGAEMPATLSGLTFAAGFLTATAVLHAAGIGLARTFARTIGRLQPVQWAGAAIACSGIVLLAAH